MSSTFWRGKRVLLTGDTGFKGAWLAIWLHELGAQVTGYALPPTDSANLFSLAGVENLLDHRDGDVRDPDHLREVMAKVHPEIAIHMAAQSLVRESYADPIGTFGTNVMGTAHLLEAVRQTQCVRVVLVITSDKCYENREWLWGYRETDPVGGHDPYSSSKGCAELVVSGYRRSFFGPEHFTKHGVAIASARAGNVIGGGDWAKDRLVPDIMRALTAGRRPVIRYPDAVRPWQHVLDPLAGYLLLAERLWLAGPEYAEAWNFGPPEQNACTVGALAGRICSLWSQSARWEHERIDQPHEAGHLKLDSSKARARLLWEPRWSLELTLRKTIEVYRAHAEGHNIAQIVRGQIQEYSACAKPQ